MNMLIITGELNSFSIILRYTFNTVYIQKYKYIQENCIVSKENGQIWSLYKVNTYLLANMD
jgi:hypothetical protein